MEFVEKRVLVIDGNRADSPNFVPALRKKGYKVEVVHSGKEALQQSHQLSPDIIVINAVSLRTNGKRICAQIRRELNGCPIILIQAEGEPVNGSVDADAVLVLPFTARKLINRIRALVPTESDKTLSAGPITLDLERHLVQCEGRQARLTPKLAQLLEKLMRKQGEVQERERLFASVWQTQYTGDTRTLDVHISWLRQAIEADPRHPSYIKTIRGVGYRLDPE
jgi:DNA-binding response OmpR family regulator